MFIWFCISCESRVVRQDPGLTRKVTYSSCKVETKLKSQFQFEAYLISCSSRSVNIWLHLNISSKAWSLIPWCIRGIYQTLKNFIMSMSYCHLKKLWDFPKIAWRFNIRPICLYASSRAPRCPFRMIFQMQLLVNSVQRRLLHIWMLHKHIIKTH